MLGAHMLCIWGGGRAPVARRDARAHTCDAIMEAWQCKYNARQARPKFARDSKVCPGLESLPGTRKCARHDACPMVPVWRPARAPLAPGARAHTLLQSWKAAASGDQFRFQCWFWCWLWYCCSYCCSYCWSATVHTVLTLNFQVRPREHTGSASVVPYYK